VVVETRSSETKTLPNTGGGFGTTTVLFVARNGKP